MYTSVADYQTVLRQSPSSAHDFVTIVNYEEHAEVSILVTDASYEGQTVELEFEAIIVGYDYVVNAQTVSLTIIPFVKPDFVTEPQFLI